MTDEAAHPFRLSRRGLLTGAAALAGATAGLTSARAATAAPAGLAVTSSNAQLVADYTWAGSGLWTGRRPERNPATSRATGPA